MAPSAHPISPQNYGLLIGLAVLVGVILLRNSRPRALRIERLWIRPAIFLALMASTLVAAPPALTPAGLTLIIACLVVGCAVGWLRGRSMRIDVHPETHDITSRASPIGMVFILALVVIRLAMRGAVAQNATVMGVAAPTATTGLILLAVGMMVSQGLEMWLRARRLLADARTAKASRAVGGAPIVQ